MKSTNQTQMTERLDDEQVEAISDLLTSQLAAAPWQPLLEALLITGVANSKQLSQVTGLDRMPLARLIEQIEKLTRDQPLFSWIGRTLSQPGSPGNPPKIFQLTEAGASVLRSLGYADAHACGLRDDIAILHALAMVDVHRAIQRSGATVTTDRQVKYAQTFLRPDHLVTVDGGKNLIIEIEQDAQPKYLPRIARSLENKAEFFASSESQGVLKEIRMVLNLKRGKSFTKTLQQWEKGMGILADSKKPGFRLFAIPLSEFLEAPDIEAEKKLNWIEVSPNEKALPVGNQSSANVQSNLPRKLSYGTSRNDAVVLSALWSQFESMSKVSKTHQPDPEFFDLVSLIYDASHDTELPVIQQAGMPHASIYLLTRYLSMHPELRKKVHASLHYGRGTMRWNQTTIMHRIQIVVNSFMGYHGWRTNGPLNIHADLAAWNSDEQRTFLIRVQIRDPELLMSEDVDIVPTDWEIWHTERALEWILTALFAYAPELGLGKPEYW